VEYRKLDAALSNALANPAIGVHSFTVFISFARPLSAPEADELRAQGIAGAAPDRRVITATLPHRIIEALSELPAVRSIKLSGMSRPAVDGPGPRVA
jgi:hypothetical protein